MLRMATVFRVDAVARLKIALLFLAVFVGSTLMSEGGLSNSRRNAGQSKLWIWQDTVAYEYVHSFWNVTVTSNIDPYDFAWYQRLVGQFFFHNEQLGLRGIGIADWYRTEITIASNDKVPTIILAAAIANQGNSPTRPFGINLIEEVQLWLGQTFEWPVQFGKAFWDDKFVSPSIGIAQIMPVESRVYDPWMLFDDKISIGLMLAKLERASQAALRLHISDNDWFALTLIGNNIGDGAAAAYREYLRKYSFVSRNMKQFIASNPENKVQLARMLGYVQFLNDHEGWTLPSNIDMDYLWSLVE